MFPGGSAANIGSAQGAIVIDTRGLETAVNAVLSAVNRINGAVNQVGNTGRSLEDNLGKPLNNVNNQVNSLTKAAATLAAIFAGMKIGELAAETSQALISAQIRFEAMTGSAEKAEKQISSIRDRAKELGVPVNKALNTFAGIAPLIQKGKTGLDAYVSVMSRLAVLEPMQGLEGAAFAVRETLSNVSSGLNNYRSLANRFNLSMGDIKKAMAESGNDVAIALDKVLNKMGITEDSAKRMANTFMTAGRVLTDEFGRSLSNALGPLFDTLTPIIQGVTKFLSTLNDAAPGLLGFIGTVTALTVGVIALSVALGKVSSALKILKAATGGGLGKTGLGIASLGVGAEIGVGIVKLAGSLFNDARAKSFDLSKAFETVKQALFIAGMAVVDLFFKIVVAAQGVTGAFSALDERIKNAAANKGFRTNAEIEADKKKELWAPSPIQQAQDKRIAEIQAKLKEPSPLNNPPTQEQRANWTPEMERWWASLEADRKALKDELATIKALRGPVLNQPSQTVLTSEQLDEKIKSLLALKRTLSAVEYKAAYDAFIKETTPVSGYNADQLGTLIERMRALTDLTGGLVGAPADTGTTTATGTVAVTGLSEDIIDATKDYLADIEKIEEGAGEDRINLTIDDEEKRNDIIAKFADKRADLDKKLGEELADLDAKKADDIAKVQSDRQEKESKTRTDFADSETKRLEDHYKELDRLQRDHYLTLQEAAERLDAYAIAKENRNYAQRESDLVDNFGTETSRRKAELEKQIVDQRKSDAQRITEIESQTAKERQKLLDKNAQALIDLNVQEKKEQDERIKDYNQRLIEINNQETKEKVARNEAFVQQLAEAGDNNAKLLEIARKGGVDIAKASQSLIDSILAQYKVAQPTLLTFLKGLLPENIQDSLDIVGNQIQAAIDLVNRVRTSIGQQPDAKFVQDELTRKLNAAAFAQPQGGKYNEMELAVQEVVAFLYRVDTVIKKVDTTKIAGQDQLKNLPDILNLFFGDVGRAIGTAAAMALNINNSVSRATSPLQNLADTFKNWGTSVANTIGSIYSSLRNIINAAKERVENNQIVRTGQRVVTQFATGTSRLAETGLFYGHQDEIVVNARASDAIRSMMGNGFTSNQLASAVMAGTQRSSNAGAFQFSEGAVQIVMGDVGNRSDQEIIGLAREGLTQAINEWVAKSARTS